MIGREASAVEGTVAHAYAITPGLQIKPANKNAILIEVTRAANTRGPETTAVTSHTILTATTCITRFRQGASTLFMATSNSRSRRAITATIANGGAKKAEYSQPGTSTVPVTIYGSGRSSWDS